MNLPIGTVVLLLLIDVVATVGLSVVLGVLVARAAGKTRSIGTVLGLFLPLVGPLVWAGVVVARDPTLLGVQRVRERTPALLVAAGLLAMGAALFVICTPLGWGQITGGYHKYWLAQDASPADSWLGMFATFGTAAVLAAALVAAVLVTAWHRIAILVLLVGASWTAIAVNSLLSFRAVDGLTETVSGVTGGNATVSASAGPANWLVLLAGLLTIAGALRLALLPRDLRFQPRPVAAPVTVPTAPAPPAVPASIWDEPVSGTSEWSWPTTPGTTDSGRGM
jgi:hypothetical protein